MEDVKIQESTIDLENDRKGKIAVFMYRGEEDPVVKLDSAVSKYVGHEGHMEFIDINMDNPWIRVVLSGVSEMRQKAFNPLEHQLKP